MKTKKVSSSAEPKTPASRRAEQLRTRCNQLSDSARRELMDGACACFMEPRSAQRVLIAVDPNVLLELADEVEEVVGAFDLIQARVPTHQFVLPPTVVHELAFEARHAEAQPLRLRGQRAFQKARQYDIRPVDLVAVRHGIAEQVSLRLREADFCPPKKPTTASFLAKPLCCIAQSC